MDNANYHNPAVPNFDQLGPSNEELGKPIPFDDSDEPIVLDGIDEPGKPAVSHTPLDLGGPPAAPAAVPAGQGGARVAPAQRAVAPVARVAPAAPAPRPQAAAKPAGPVIASAGRISGVKTFFTKLHPGAIQFLDEQISIWLQKNPGISIKRTNVATGDVQSKKTEPNILITVWY